MPAADDAFVSLADLVRGVRGHRTASPTVEPAPVAAIAAEPEPPAQALELARDVRVFRARLIEAFEYARETLVRELAYAVVGRELQAAPADVAEIAAHLLAEHPDAQPLRLRIAAADRARIDAHAAALPPYTVDAALAPGDVILELACGHIDARLGVRLATVLEDRP